MNPTNEQIIAEANRRRQERGKDGPLLVDFIIEVMRENWTPPEPVVDPDLLIAREAAAQHWEQVYGDKSEARRRRDGWCDAGQAVTACRIAARMAREQERERARQLAEFVEDQSRRLDGVGARAHDILAKYRGEA